MKDFRQITFETLFEEGLTSLKEKDFNISSLKIVILSLKLLLSWMANSLSFSTTKIFFGF